jgi:hypothetical protein
MGGDGGEAASERSPGLPLRTSEEDSAVLLSRIRERVSVRQQTRETLVSLSHLGRGSG